MLHDALHSIPQYVCGVLFSSLIISILIADKVLNEQICMTIKITVKGHLFVAVIYLN